MKLARETHREIERFFREFYRDDTVVLPEVEIFVRRGAKVCSRLFGVHGITFGRRIFIRPELLKRDGQSRLIMPKDLLVHELTHTMQYEREGFFGFLYGYVKAYLGNLKSKKTWGIESRTEAYLEIPHEIEARDAAEKFAAFNVLRTSYSSSSSSVSSSK